MTDDQLNDLAAKVADSIFKRLVDKQREWDEQFEEQMTEVSWGQMEYKKEDAIKMVVVLYRTLLQRRPKILTPAYDKTEQDIFGGDFFNFWVVFPLAFALLFFFVLTFFWLCLNWLNENIFFNENLSFVFRCFILYGIGLFITYQLDLYL
jgi:hypothetical protein